MLLIRTRRRGGGPAERKCCLISDSPDWSPQRRPWGQRSPTLHPTEPISNSVAPPIRSRGLSQAVATDRGSRLVTNWPALLSDLSRLDHVPSKILGLNANLGNGGGLKQVSPS